MAAGPAIDTLANGAVRVQNGAQGRWAAAGERPWVLVEDLRIGRVDGDGSDVFGSIRDVIPTADGRVWVLDAQALELRQFDSTGTHVRTVGRAGQGPGEFGFNPCAFAAPDDEVWVESGGRWQRFDSDGGLLGSQQVTRSLGCGIRAWRGDEFAAAFVIFDPATREMAGGIILHDRLPDGSVTIRDTVWPPEPPDPRLVSWTRGRGSIREYLPLYHQPGRFLVDSGMLWTTDGGGAYTFRRQSLEGDTLLIVERQYDPVPVPDSIRRQEIEDLTAGERGFPDDFDSSDVPHVFPPFERIVEANDGTLWLRRRIGLGESAWDVFDRTGEFLGTVTLPAGTGTFSIHAATTTHLYGVARDDYDVSYLVRLRIAG